MLHTVHGKKMTPESNDAGKDDVRKIWHTKKMTPEKMTYGKDEAFMTIHNGLKGLYDYS